MKYSKEEIRKRAEEAGLPESKIIMLIDNPPEKLENIECANCKNKKKTIIIEKE